MAHAQNFGREDGYISSELTPLHKEEWTKSPETLPKNSKSEHDEQEVQGEILTGQRREQTSWDQLASG